MHAVRDDDKPGLKAKRCPFFEESEMMEKIDQICTNHILDTNMESNDNPHTTLNRRGRRRSSIIELRASIASFSSHSISQHPSQEDASYPSKSLYTYVHPSFRIFFKNKDAANTVHAFSEDCYITEVVSFLFAVLEYQDLCKYVSIDKQFFAFQKIVTNFVIVGAPSEINISDIMRNHVTKFATDEKTFCTLLQRLEDRTQVFQSVYLEMEKLFWSNLYSRENNTRPLAKEILEFAESNFEMLQSM